MRTSLFLVGTLLAALTFLQPAEERPPVAPAPPLCPGPGPCPLPQPQPKPKPSPRPWGLDISATVGGRVAPDGTQIQVDYPGDRHVKNVGGSDGAGLCVFTSIQHAADWGGVDVLADFQAFMRKRPGGGYPSKVDAMIKAICAEKGKEVPQYLNVEAADIELIEAALSAGHMVSCTYSRSPTKRYGGSTIAHMVNVVHAHNGQYAILDNNYIGDTRYEWLSRAEFESVRPRWVVILLGQSPSPPPPPKPLD